jgi:hypothetical protein
MTTTILEAPVSIQSAQQRPVVFHYHTKADITRSIVTGEPVAALCGKTSTVSDGNPGKYRGGAAIVCPACLSIYDGLRADD